MPENNNDKNQTETLPAVESGDLLACPFCKMPDECQDDNKPRTTFLGNVTDHKGEMFILGFAVRCGWCGAQGPNAGMPNDAKGYWNDRNNLQEARKRDCSEPEKRSDSPE